MNPPAIIDLLSRVPDPRVEGRCLHKLSDVLFIAICTLLSNGEDFEDMVTFASQSEWVRPGDVFGSGTVGTGCALENGQWPKPGDKITLWAEGIGQLENQLGSKEDI